VDPWYDYLAIPVAPLVLMAQWATLFVPHRTVRVALSGASTASIGAMLVYIVLRPISEDEGAVGEARHCLLTLSHLRLSGVGSHPGAASRHRTRMVA
jgi:hypothetical protein